MQQLILVIHVLVALSLLALVLVQHGKGADIGASFGSGAANTMFGSVGPASFLMKLTGVLAAVFFATSIVLVYLGGKLQPQTMQFNMPTQTTTPSAPAQSQPVSPMPATTTNPENSFAPSTAPSNSPIEGTEQKSQ